MISEIQNSETDGYNDKQDILKNFIYSLHFVLICCGLAQIHFIHVLQGFFTGTWAIIWLPKCQWRNPEEYELTHLPLDKMAATFADDIFKHIFKHIFLNENVKISIRISLKFVPKGPIDNKSALVQVMAWRRTGDKSLPDPMLTQFTDA